MSNIVNNLLVSCFLAISATDVLAQTEVNVWTRAVGASNYDFGLAVTIDPIGNVIASGRTHSNLGPVLYGQYDLFVTKYDASGNKQWLVQRGTSVQESGEGVATDASGNIYIAGYTAGDLDGNSSAGNWDIFLMKFDPVGNWLWTRQDGTGQDDDAHAVAVDSAGNIYITGYVRGDFHGITRVGSADIFISKYDPAGNRLWSALFGSTGVDEGFGIGCDSSNNVYVTGYSQESIEGNPYLGAGDNVLAKYNSAGERQWLREWGTGNADTGYSVKTDASGNVYLSGYCNGALYGPKSGGRDIFLAKYDSSGSPVWGKQRGTGETDQAWGLAVDAGGNAYIAGEAGGSLDGNPYEGAADMFLAKYDSSGSELWTKEIGTIESELASGVALDANGGIYVAGWSYGDFGGNANQGLADVFLMKFAPSNSPPPIPTINAATAVTTGGFTANWSPASWAAGYRLDLSTNSTFSTYVSGYQNLDVGNVLSRSATGLSAATTYYYRVRAYNTNGISGNSGTISLTTLTPVCTDGTLANAGFEGGNSGGVATGWTGYQRSPNPTTVWSIQTASPPTGGGLQYQQIANTSGTGGGGVRQNVTGCTVGGTYIVAGWMRGNSASATCTVKCSPTASTNWATAMDLNPPQTYSGATWTAFSGTVVAAGTNMTIWLEGQTGGTGQNKAACFDSVTVTCAGGATPAPHFDSVNWLSENGARLVVTGAAGGGITIYWSSNLVNWTQLTNLVNSSGTVEFTDIPPATAAQRYYRATTP